MNKKLDELETFFSTRTEAFSSTISLHEGRFTEQDYQEFEGLLEEIKTDAENRIQSFFFSRFKIRSSVYETEIDSFKSDGNHINTELKSFRENLIQQTISLKEEQSRKEELMEHFSQRFRRNAILKKCLKILKDHERNRKRNKALERKMDLLYQRNLLKKSFFPWRTYLLILTQPDLQRWTRQLDQKANSERHQQHP